MKKLIAVLSLIACVASFAACAPKTPPAEPAPEPQPQTQEQPAPEPAQSAEIQFTDSVGRVVTVPAKIEKIAPSGPLAQIVLFSLAPDKFVGLATKWSADAEQYIDSKYYNMPVLGQLYGGANLNLEELAAAGPQIIIDVGEPKQTIKEDMDGITAQLGIPAVHITATTESMGEAYRTLGKLLGLQERAERLAKYCDETYARTLKIMEQVGEQGKVKLAYCMGDQGLNAIARGSFHAEIIDLLCDNAVVVDNPSSKGTGNEVDMEQLLLWDPEVILFAPGSVYSTVGSDDQWSHLKAIQNNRYYEVPIGPYNWMGFPPSVNRYLGMQWMLYLLYPDKAGFELRDEVKEHYKLFYHQDLTDAQYDQLVQNSVGKSN
jgi:iron complex transport system substrate-binding protein